MGLRFSLGMWLLWSCTLPAVAQEEASGDTIPPTTAYDVELKLNPAALRELRQNFFGTLRPSTDKSWLEPNSTLPTLPHQEQAAPRGLTLSPYTATTKYNWDPVAQCKIDIDRPTSSWRAWRLPAGCRVSGGYDLMYIFTRDFWDVARNRRRARTREVLAAYGDSITISAFRQSASPVR